MNDRFSRKFEKGSPEWIQNQVLIQERLQTTLLETNAGGSSPTGALESTQQSILTELTDSNVNLNQIETILNNIATSAKQEESKTVLDNILLELKDDTFFNETVWTDSVTGDFYIRVREKNQDTGTVTLTWQDVAGNVVAPTVANLVQIVESVDYEVIEGDYRATAAGTGYAINDWVKNVTVINTKLNTFTVLWRNITQNTTLASAPLNANLILISDTQFLNGAQKTRITNGTNDVSVKDTTPISTDFGLITRNIPSGTQDANITNTTLSTIAEQQLQTIALTAINTSVTASQVVENVNTDPAKFIAVATKDYSDGSYQAIPSTTDVLTSNRFIPIGGTNSQDNKSYTADIRELSQGNPLLVTLCDANGNPQFTATPVIGQQLMASSSPVVIASDQSNVPTNTNQVNGFTVDTNIGTASSGTQRVAVAENSRVRVWDSTNNLVLNPANTAVVSNMVSVPVSLMPNNNTVKIGESVFIQSAGNSSTFQLAAGATFTGAIESALSYPNAIISLRCNTTCTLFIDQFSDAAGTIQYPTISYSLLAGQGFNNTVSLAGSYYRLRVTNTGGATTTNLFLETWLGILPTLPQLTANGNSQIAISEIGKSSAVTLEQSITTGGTAQVAMAANTNRNYFEIINIDQTNPLFVRVGNTATVTSSIRIMPNGSYTSPNNICPTAAISVISATTGHKFNTLEL